MRRMDEKGVSPVIGVILMVAITVILAAVIASFVFGMGGQLQPTKTPGFTVKRTNDTTVEITLTSYGGAQEINSCSLKQPSGITGTHDFSGIGDTWQVTDSALDGPVRLVMVCNVDGNDQVVLDTTV